MNFLIFLTLLISPFYLIDNGREVLSFLEPILDRSAIIDTKQIKIPGYPNAYNPSIIPYKDGYLLSFRYITKRPEFVKDRYRTDFSFVGLVKLDKKFKIDERSIQLLNIKSYSSRFTLTAEDARLVSVGDRIFMIFNDLPDPPTRGKFAIYLAELADEGAAFALKGAAKPLKYLHTRQVEKNWSPFVVGNKLYVIYSDQPRVILEVDLETGICQEAARTVVDRDWSLGEIRGGTPACLIDDLFLTFFHSCFPANTNKGRVYVMGAYVFEKEFPFSIRKMTLGPLGDLDDYSKDNKPKVVFPAGLCVEGRSIFVAWGKADRQIFITTFDWDKLLNSMKDCSY